MGNLRIIPNVPQEILDAFKIKGVWQKGNKSAPITDDGYTGFYVYYLWAVHIRYYKANFTIAFMKFSEKRSVEQKVIIAVEQEKRLKLLPALDMTDSQDPLLPALNGLNLAGENFSGATIYDPGYISLDFSNNNLHINLYLPLFSEESSIKNLQESSLKILKDLLLLYKDDSLLELLEVQEYGLD